MNECTPEQTGSLEDLARVHDIGKIQRSAKPQASVDLLPHYSIVDKRFTALVKYHDTNVPWWNAGNLRRKSVASTGKIGGRETALFGGRQQGEAVIYEDLWKSESYENRAAFGGGSVSLAGAA
jgi:hypothetical protein